MLDILNNYLKEGLVYKQSHPDLPLFIWNYSEKVQYERLWNDTLIKCRGLITDATGKVIVQPFPKFFNYEELIEKNTIPWDSEYFYVQEKIDGSLGILFYFQDRWVMATRGSFTSEQAIKGLKLVQNKYDLSKFIKELVYLVEIIYPENRIVVKYEEEKVVFLSCVYNRSLVPNVEDQMDELNWQTSLAIFSSNGISEDDIVQTKHYDKFSPEFYQDLKSKEEDNKEGFVIRFFPSNFRLKIKFEEYVRLHKIMTNISTKTIWEALKNGDGLDALLKDVPDEFFEKIKNYENHLIRSHRRISYFCKGKYNIFRYGETTGKFPEPTKKEFAEFVRNNITQELHSIMFLIWDGKDATQAIWKILKPTYEKL